MEQSFPDPKLLAANLKKYVTAYAKGLPGSAGFRRRVLDAHELDTILALTDDFFGVREAA